MQEQKPFPESRKRPLEDAVTQTQSSTYYKVRALLRDLKPHFIEVLKTPDFRNCKAASDIREGMTLLLDLYKEMAEQSNKHDKCSNGDVGHQRQKPRLDLHPPQNGAPVHIVGGSAFGWNFVTYSGTQAVYYGRTKEAFRAANAE